MAAQGTLPSCAIPLYYVGIACEAVGQCFIRNSPRNERVSGDDYDSLDLNAPRASTWTRICYKARIADRKTINSESRIRKIAEKLDRTDLHGDTRGTRGWDMKYTRANKIVDGTLRVTSRWYFLMKIPNGAHPMLSHAAVQLSRWDRMGQINESFPAPQENRA